MPDEVQIEFPDEGVTTAVDVTPMGPRLYRLDAVPAMADSASFGDVIEAEPIDANTLRFVRVAEPTRWRTYDFLLSPAMIDGDRLKAVLAKADGLGAHWERIMSGLLFICVPPGVDWDPTGELFGP